MNNNCVFRIFDKKTKGGRVIDVWLLFLCYIHRWERALVRTASCISALLCKQRDLCVVCKFFCAALAIIVVFRLWRSHKVTRKCNSDSDSGDSKGRRVRCGKRDWPWTGLILCYCCYLCGVVMQLVAHILAVVVKFLAEFHFMCRLYAAQSVGCKCFLVKNWWHHDDDFFISCDNYKHPKQLYQWLAFLKRSFFVM